MKKFFGIDLRGLAVMRILLGLTLLYDLGVRWRSVDIFLADSGVLTLAQARINSYLTWVPSVHFLSGEASFQSFLLIVHACCALALLVGWRTSVMAVIVWYLTLSLHFRNELILNGGDYVLRALLFWGMFLPWGKRFSVDARREGQEAPANVVANLATVALILQFCLLYWGAAMNKHDSVWVQDYMALYYALHLDCFATPVGVWLREFPWLLKVGTIFTLCAQWFAPLFLVVGSKWLRALGVATLVFFHLAIALTMNVGTFWIIPIAGLVALLPSEFWDRFSEPTQGRELPAPHPIFSAALGVLILVLPYLNLSQVKRDEFKVPMPLYIAMRTLGFHWGWDMFARSDDNLDGWYILEAQLANGEVVDLLRGSEMTLEKPPAGQMYRDQRWRRYIVDLYREEHEPAARALVQYLARQWNEKNNAKVEKVVVHYMAEQTTYPFEEVEPQDCAFLRISDFD